jgi:hypothetical protein
MARVGRRGNRRWCLPMPGSGGHGGLGSTEVRARLGLKATREASVGAHGHVACSSNGDCERKMELVGGGVNGVAARAWRARGVDDL